MGAIFPMPVTLAVDIFVSQKRDGMIYFIILRDHVIPSIRGQPLAIDDIFHKISILFLD